ncbi:FAD binding domain-containing protein [candidate division CSSED10-310 bacterium]|uniref:FAD binding domain-containing protein n=1 Tax=candidate division CSSED10-310 bacterium TaxID=2855610 RepID=A0ABV6Z587_UNCC1
MPSLHQDFYYPQTKAEALALLSEGKERMMPLAGGTAVTLMQRRKEVALVDLWNIGLNTIQEQNGSLAVGAMMTVTELMRHESIQSYAQGALVQACRHLASTSLRNLITIGGNIIQIFNWSDLPPLFLALEAEVELQSQGGSRRTPIETFLSPHPRKNLKPDELLVNVILPPTAQNRYAQFTKFCQNQVNFSLATVATNFRVKDGVIQEARIAAGAVRGRPFRLNELEEMLVDKSLDKATLEAAETMARQVVKPTRTFRASVEYRQNLFAIIVRRHLEAAQSHFSLKG